MLTLEELKKEMKAAEERVVTCAQQVEFWTRDHLKAQGVLEHLHLKHQQALAGETEPAPQA